MQDNVSKERKRFIFKTQARSAQARNESMKRKQKSVILIFSTMIYPLSHKKRWRKRENEQNELNELT